MLKFMVLMILLVFPEFCFSMYIDDGIKSDMYIKWKGDRRGRLVSKSKRIIIRMAGKKMFKMVKNYDHGDYRTTLVLPDDLIKYSLYFSQNDKLYFDNNVKNLTSNSWDMINRSDKIFQCFTKMLLRDMIGTYKNGRSDTFSIQLEKVLELYNLLDVTSSYQEINSLAMLFELTDRFTVENYCKENGYL